MVDMHCDETDDPLSRHIEQLAYETQRLGLQAGWLGRTSPRCTRWTIITSRSSSVDRRGGVSAIPNPLINIMLQGRHDTFPNGAG